MKYLRSLMQQSVTACKNQAKLIQQFTLSLLYLLIIHIVALLFFFLFRLVLFTSIDYQFPPDIQNNFLMQATAFIKGLWFDNVIACYILLLPLVILWITALCNYHSKWVFRFISIFFILFYSLSFIISAANIPYFSYFFKTINSSIYNWFGYGATTAGMVLGETSFYFPIFLGLISILLLSGSVLRLSSYFYHLINSKSTSISPINRLCIFAAGAVCIGLCLFGIRGRMGYNPIRVSQAYYCTDPFLNQLGVNPVFNLLTSTLDDNRKENRYLHLMPEQEAITNMQSILQRKGIEGISPIAREVKCAAVPTQKNVVLIFMESMSANLMEHFGSTKKLTPFLDSLYLESLSFDHFYSAGIHTNHGMYATLYSFPAIVNKVLLKDTDLSLCLNDKLSKGISSAKDTFCKSAYSLQTFRIENGRVRYDNGKPLAADSLSSGLDPSHIAMTDIGVKLDSLYYGGRNMKAIISQFVLKERSGVEIVSATGRMVSNDKVLRVPSLKLETRDSYLELNAAMDWNALDFKDEGLVSARLMADIGKPDVVRFMGSMDEKFIRQYPSEPLRIRAHFSARHRKFAFQARSVWNFYYFSQRGNKLQILGFSFQSDIPPAQQTVCQMG